MQTDWLLGLAGGALIGLAATLLLLSIGRVAGVSGMVHGLVSRIAGDVGWRAAFVLGLMVTGALLAHVRPQAFGTEGLGLGRAAVAGLLVGLGTRLGGGCTAGHGICGLSRRSTRSIVATITFLLVAMLTVLARRLTGGLS